MTTTEPAPYVARTPDDLIAMVPLTLGFCPEESVTMLTFGGPRAFQGRVDLPADARDDPAVVRVLLDPARAHRVACVAFVVHSRRAVRFPEIGSRLVVAFLAADIEVVEVLRADGERYWSLDCLAEPDGCDGHDYDVSAHPFAVRAVLDGRVTLGSRDELAATLRPAVPDPAGDTAVAVEALRHGGRLAAADLSREARWLRETVRRHVARGTRPDDRRLGRLLADLEVVGLRDRVWEQMTCAEASAHVELWRDACRRAPQEHRPAAAAVLAFAAWLAGDGALAWCAVDLGRERGAQLDLLDFVDDLLSSASPPRDGLGGRHRSSSRTGADEVVVRGPW